MQRIEFDLNGPGDATQKDERRLCLREKIGQNFKQRESVHVLIDQKFERIGIIRIEKMSVLVAIDPDRQVLVFEWNAHTHCGVYVIWRIELDLLDTGCHTGQPEISLATFFCWNEEHCCEIFLFVHPVSHFLFSFHNLENFAKNSLVVKNVISLTCLLEVIHINSGGRVAVFGQDVLSVQFRS
jgi:hypothetical protein